MINNSLWKTVGTLPFSCRYLHANKVELLVEVGKIALPSSPILASPFTPQTEQWSQLLENAANNKCAPRVTQKRLLKEPDD